MGYAPQWYLVIKAARYLGVAPWELMSQPRDWFEMALTSQSAEIRAENEAHERAKRKK